MGRGGGGGGHRSGGGGGHRSGGGHSSSHRGGSYSSHHSSSGFHSTYRPRPAVHNHYYGGGYSYGYRRGGGSGAIAVLVAVVVLIIFVSIVGAMLASSYGVTKSTIQREPLPRTAYSQINDWFEDDWNWVGTGNNLVKGLRYFQQETGVQVYVVITDDMQGCSSMEQLANAVYDDVFGNDEGHAVFVWYEPGDMYGNGNGNYHTYLCVGVAAGAVLDSEAVEIVLDYFDQYYADTSLSEDELLGRTFTKAADRMMTVTKSPVGTIVILLVVLAIFVVVFSILKAKFKRDKERAEEQQQILNTPLEYLSADTKDLEDRYGG